MNRNVFFYLVLVLLSILFVGCGQTNNSATKNNSSNTSEINFDYNMKNSVEESVKTTSPPTENEANNKQQNNSVEKKIPQNNQQDNQQNNKQNNQPDVQTYIKEYSTENGVFIVTHSNTVKDICEFDLAGIYVTPKIQPLNNSGKYSHIDIKNEDNIYIDVIIDVKNLSNKAKLTGELIVAKIKIKSTEYTCFSVAENADNTDLEGNDSINPLEMREIHYVAEVPRTEANGQVEVILTINGKNYSNKFLLES